jgi:hypothetical protein
MILFSVLKAYWTRTDLEAVEICCKLLFVSRTVNHAHIFVVINEKIFEDIYIRTHPSYGTVYGIIAVRRSSGGGRGNRADTAEKVQVPKSTTWERNPVFQTPLPRDLRKLNTFSKH